LEKDHRKGGGGPILGFFPPEKKEGEQGHKKQVRLNQKKIQKGFGGKEQENVMEGTRLTSKGKRKIKSVRG